MYSTACNFEFNCDPNWGRIIVHWIRACSAVALNKSGGFYEGWTDLSLTRVLNYRYTLLHLYDIWFRATFRKRSTSWRLVTTQLLPTIRDFRFQHKSDISVQNWNQRFQKVSAHWKLNSQHQPSLNYKADAYSILPLRHVLNRRSLNWTLLHAPLHFLDLDHF